MAALLLLASCASATPTSAIKADLLFCEAAKPISWSSHDTDETIHEIKDFNHQGYLLCGWPE